MGVTLTDPSSSYEIDGGVYCADFIGRDQHNTYGFSAEDVEKIIQKMLDFLSAGAEILPRGDGSLATEWNGQSLVFHPRAAQLLASQRNERAYLLSLTLHKDYLQWATNFIPLKADVDVISRQSKASSLDIPLAYLEVRLPPPGSGIEAQVTTEELEDITEALTRHDAFIILGEPGCGKTTTLQKIAYDHALDRLQNQGSLTPVFVRLSLQHDDSPFVFLEKTWNQHTGSSFADALAAGRLLLLLDGVNELPHDQSLGQRLKDWRLFTEEYCGANKIVFTSREREYGGFLDLPRVLVRPLDEERIAEYLRRNQADGLLDALQRASPDARRRLQDLTENPLHLAMLTHYYRENQASLDNRGQLFHWFARTLIGREKSYHPENIPHNIPHHLSEEVLPGALAQLAFNLQEKKLGTVVPLAIAQENTPEKIVYKGKSHPIQAEELFQFARGAGIFDPNLELDIRFQHQMLHEYFAALELLSRFQAGEDLSRMWVAPRLQSEMPPADVGTWDPLPEPPSTGWEVTTLLACGLALEPARLIEAVRKVNPVLAGRCLDESGISHQEVQQELRAVQQNLLEELYNPQVHLRARLQAGFMLGRIGDPRFEPREVNGVEIILPEMVQVPAGRYWLGSPEDDEEGFEVGHPTCRVELPDFAISKWPVTNAEYACFMRAGGYANESYWRTDLARRWLRGEEVTGGQLKTVLETWEFLRSLPDLQATMEQSGLFSPQQIDNLVWLAGLTEDEVIAWYGQQVQGKSRRQPGFWDDPGFNNPSQPVVGITWFEANAYCAWISAVSGRVYRLPSEAEWEAAGRGALTPEELGVRNYPWGRDWDSDKANTIEGRLLRPSPVGAYAAAGGNSPFGGEDQAGNVWNWTSSLYLPYPYDRQQSEQPEAEGERTLRGGSWFTDRRSARCAYRIGNVPGFFSNYLGFRLVSPGIFLDSGC